MPNYGCGGEGEFYYDLDKEIVLLKCAIPHRSVPCCFSLSRFRWRLEQVPDSAPAAAPNNAKSLARWSQQCSTLANRAAGDSYSWQNCVAVPAADGLLG